MDSRHFLDRNGARFLAGLVCVLALSGLALTWHKQNNTDTAGRPAATAGVIGAGTASAPSVNPKFEECRTKRSGDIADMLKKGVIDQAKHDDFLANALQTCAGMFPPES
ncbi:MAG: hypothetical protein AAFW74_04060 [Pseudomonadota bacterium]